MSLAVAVLQLSAATLVAAAMGLLPNAVIYERYLRPALAAFFVCVAILAYIIMSMQRAYTAACIVPALAYTATALWSLERLRLHQALTVMAAAYRRPERLPDDKMARE
jgi:hypothetical protein